MHDQAPTVTQANSCVQPDPIVGACPNNGSQGPQGGKIVGFAASNTCGIFENERIQTGGGFSKGLIFFNVSSHRLPVFVF